MSLGIKPEDIKSKADLGKIPVLTRELIIENYDKIVSRKINEIPHRWQEYRRYNWHSNAYLLDNRSWSFSNADYVVNWKRTVIILVTNMLR